MSNNFYLYNGKAKIICIGGISSALSVVLQSAPVFVPVLGMILSPFSTLPIALAAAFSPASGLIAALCSGLILFFISAQEAAIFICGTGLLGLALGLFVQKGIVQAILISGTSLFFGLNILLYGFNINFFGPATVYISDFIVLFIAAFSILYALLWFAVIKLLVKRIFPADQTKK